MEKKENVKQSTSLIHTDYSTMYARSWDDVHLLNPVRSSCLHNLILTPLKRLLHLKDTDIWSGELFSFSSLFFSTNEASIRDGFLCFFPYKIPENPNKPASPKPRKKAVLGDLLPVSAGFNWCLVEKFRSLTVPKNLLLGKDWKNLLINGAAILEWLSPSPSGTGRSS